MLLHSFNQFHAAGHGTFFSGQITVDSSHERQLFNWGFDCGSRRSGRMPALVEDLATTHKVEHLDMLCLSHFDADHVNGLKHLLARFSVGTLVLPYLPLSTRLELAANLNEEHPGSADAMLACLDTAGFLAIRGLTKKITRIALVKGGDNPLPPEDNERNDIPRDFPDERSRRRDAPPELELSLSGTPLDHAEYLGGGRLFQEADRKRCVAVTSVAHDAPVTLSGGYWEFLFFNKSPENGLAPVSGKSLADVRKDIRNILSQYELSKPSDSIVEGWRADLRGCYEKHFGKSALARNDISLCVLSRPTRDRQAIPCTLFGIPKSRLGDIQTALPLGEDKTGVLLTGDLTFDSTTRAAMEAHWGRRRWQQIAVMQIPHHGSAASWELGVEAMCHHKSSVFCVPDKDPAGHHPDANLVVALKDHNPVLANYSNSVQFAFHVRY